MAPVIRVKLSQGQQASIDTLVLYTFAASDPEYRANFEYFLKYGVGGDNVFYAFIVQQVFPLPVGHFAPSSILAIQDMYSACHGDPVLLAASHRAVPCRCLTTAFPTCRSCQRMPSIYITRMSALIGAPLAGQSVQSRWSLPDTDTSSF